MMHQMQAYAHYVTSLSQHGQHLLPVVPPAPSTLPEESPYPQGGPSSINGQGLVPEFAHTEDKADAPPDIDDGINSGSDAQVDDSGPGSTSVPGDAPIESNFGAESGPTEKKAAESLSRATSSAEHVASETPSAETSAGSLTFEQPHPSSPPTQGPLSPNSSHPSLPSGAYPLLPFHPHSSNPQSPMGMQTSFAFSHLPYPGHIQGPQPQLFPIVPLGLSGIGPGGHMQTLQSPIHPGMMPLSGMHAFPVHPMTHAPRPSSPAIFSPSTPSSVPHPLSPIHPPHGSIGTGMGIGLMNGTHSSLWMNGIGPSSKLGSLSPDLGGPSSPISSWTQERGRRKGRGHSGRGMLVQDVSVNVVNGGSLGQVLGAASGEGQEENEGEGEPTLQDEDGEEDEEEGGFNVLLADAILKRPSSIRMGSSKRGSVREKTSTPPSLSGSISLNGVWPGIGGSVDVKTLSTDVVDASREETEEQQEFTFPSLSELGNVAREKRVNGSVDSRIALAFGNGEAARVSGASSPPLAEFISSSEFAPAALVPDPVPAPHVA
ncbi:hypothetical protein FA15DRAFT_437662 [Coprinopsis marcescibilis]|uniref:Uncharacterized protein n=1 Tax=Coprinopsis marcescibilis TaxID=230819 RepID=A0A5C3KUX1_COPMA|nr:hypothetical protein FA15DRAFT_437662 [Coprinopsis marcescibilis]